MTASTLLTPVEVSAQEPAALEVHPASAHPRQLIQVTGSEFGRGELVAITFDDQRRHGVVASPGGSVSGWIRVPAAALHGAHVVRATGLSSHLSAEASVQVRTNWSQFQLVGHRGFNPYERHLDRTNVSGLQLVWQFPFPTGCTSYSGPSVVDGRVFVGNYCRRVYAVDEEDGRLLWAARTDGKVDSTPAAVGGRVFVATGYPGGRVYAFDAEDGSLLWAHRLSDQSYSSPVVRDGIVYQGVIDGQVFALKARTGALLWRASVPGGRLAGTPVVAGTSLFANSDNGHVYALDASSGDVLWRGDAGGVITSSPVIDGPTVVLGSEAGLLFAFDRDGCSRATCQPVWRSESDSYGAGTPSVAYGMVFMADDEGYLNALPAQGCGTPTCPVLWRSELGGPTGTGAAIAGHVAYSGSSYNNAVSAFDVTTGELLWRHAGEPTSYGGSTTEAVVDETLFANLTWDRTLYAFRVPQG